MPITADHLGASLRSFYRYFGVRGEGPSETVDIPSVLQIADSQAVEPNIERDVQLLDHLNADVHLHQSFRECDVILEEIANHANSTELLEALDNRYTTMNLDLDQVFSGIHWYAEACGRDPRTQPLSEEMENHPNEWELGLQVVGATVLRLYIALVYLRGDWIRDAVDRSNPNTSASLARYQRLFNHDIVRHLRNALAHGHIRPTIAGLWFRDRTFEAIITAGFINNWAFADFREKSLIEQVFWNGNARFMAF